MSDSTHAMPPAATAQHDSPSAPVSSQGILVMTTSLQLLYMNGAARTLCGHLTAHRTGLAIHGIVPTEVLELCDALVNALSAHSDLKDWDQLQLTRVTGPADHPVQLRGLGLPERGGLTDSRLIILMEEATPRPTSAVHPQAREQFHLTEQEERVITCLLQGLTNKEIASQLLVSEHTVKEHLRAIMQKTGTTTRTGVLSKALLPGPATATPSTRSASSHARPDCLRLLMAQAGWQARAG
jgi:DNA-binding CsgD family transcriptional regulator